MLKRAILVITLASAVMLGILLTTTTPSTTGPLGILSFFIFMYLAALGVLTFLFRALSLVFSRAPFARIRRPSTKEFTLRSSYYYASVIALVPVMLIAMQSVGQIGPYQVSLVLFFAIVAWVYVANRMA